MDNRTLREKLRAMAASKNEDGTPTHEAEIANAKLAELGPEPVLTREAILSTPSAGPRVARRVYSVELDAWLIIDMDTDETLFTQKAR